MISKNRYRNIGDGDVDVLNYDKNQKQTDFGNNLKDFLILITKNCDNKITFIFNNINNFRSTLSYIGCSESKFIYDFYINLNANIKNKNHNERKVTLLRLLMNLTDNISPIDSILYYKGIIFDEWENASKLSKLYDELSKKIQFPTTKIKQRINFGDFFRINNLFDLHKYSFYKGELLDEKFIKFVLTGERNNTVSLRTDNHKIYYFSKLRDVHQDQDNFSKLRDVHQDQDNFSKLLRDVHQDQDNFSKLHDVQELSSQFLQDTKISESMNRIALKTGILSHIGFPTYDRITSLKILYTKYNNNVVIMEAKAEDEKSQGGRKASVKKEICGRIRCIYKIPGSRKEHIKHKGCLITVADYKKYMKNV